MGLFDKVKGFLNVGGVSVKITKVENPFTAGDTAMSGDFRLTSDSDRTVLSTSARFYKKIISKDSAGKDQVRTETLGSCSTKDYIANNDYPFEIAKGETKDLSFLMINVNCPPSLISAGGVTGAVGMLGAFASKLNNERVSYHVDVSADVKGTPFDPSDTVMIQVIEKQA